MGKGSYSPKKKQGFSWKHDLVNQAVDIYHKTHNEKDWLSYVTKECGNDARLVQEMCNKVDYRIFIDELINS